MKALFCTLLILLSTSRHTLAQGTFDSIASFDAFNAAALIAGTNGLLYGAGQGGYGVIFSLDPSSGQISVLHSFDGGDGWKPLALLQGIDGNFYGVTEQGAAAGCTNGCGEVFEMDPTSPYALHVIYQFTGGNEPYQPYYLVQGPDGTLYGLTYEGTNGTPGGIFSLTTSGANFVLLHSCSFSDCWQPATLLPPYGGVLYGASALFGPENNGEIFSINTDGSGFGIVWAFTGGSDGANPTTLARTASGALFGMAADGPNDDFLGEFFQVNSNSVSVLYSFPNNGSEGVCGTSLTSFCTLTSVESPSGSGSNVLLGTSFGGGSDDAGTIFQYQPENSSFSVLYSLGGGPVDPSIPLVQSANDGAFYGTTNAGGTYHVGVAFEFVPPQTWVWAPPADFCPSNASCPYIGYVELNANLYALNSTATGSMTTSYGSGTLATSVNFSGLAITPPNPVIGYPDLQYGYQPQGCNVENDTYIPPCPTTSPLVTSVALPIQVSKFPNAWTMINYSMSPPQQGNVDLIFDIWVTQLTPPQIGICKDDVELEIWLYNSPTVVGSARFVETLPIPTFIGGVMHQNESWNAFVGTSGSGGEKTKGSSCPDGEHGPATAVSLVLGAAHTQENEYVGIPLSNALTAMIDTLVAYNGSQWTAANLDNYWVNDIDFGSEFGCNPSKQSYCSSFQASYSFNISDYCFTIGSGTYNWSDYACPAVLQ
jgi:hypothetical protein